MSEGARDGGIDRQRLEGRFHLAQPLQSQPANVLVLRGQHAIVELSQAKAYGEGAVEYRQVAIRAAELGLILDRTTAETFPQLAGGRPGDARVAETPPDVYNR